MMTLLERSRKGPRRNRPLKKRELPGKEAPKGIRLKFWTLCMGLGVLILAGAGYAGGKQLVGWALEWTAVEHVSVMGLVRLTHEEVMAHMDMPQHASLLSLSMEEMAGRLQAHPWVESVQVDRVFPHSLVVHVVEREPAAVLRASRETLLLDATGHVLPGKVSAEAKRLPVVEGITPQSVADHGPEGHPRAKQGIGIATLLAQYFSGRPKVDVSEPLTTVVDLPQVRFQFGENAEEQLQRFLVLYPTIKSEIDGQSQEVDLRFSQKVILRKRTM